MKTKTILLSLCLSLTVLFAVIVWQGFDYKLMQQGFENYGDFENFPMDIEDSELIAKKISSYISGFDKSLQLEYWGENGKQYLFSSKEIYHFKDVKNIFLIAQSIFFTLLFFDVHLISKLHKLGFSTKHYILGIAVFLLIVAVKILIVSLNFASAFLVMHKLLFANENWLLNPKEDFIINIMPLYYFIHTAKIMLFQFTVMFTFLHMCLMLLLGKFKSNQNA